MRRCSGIWPPSKPGLRAEPLRLFWPFSPRPAVLPSPLPGPRPTRLRLRTAPRAGFSLSRPTLSPPLLDDRDQVRDLVDHPPHRLRVLPLHDLVHAPQPEPAHRLALVAGAADHAPDHLDLDRARRLALALGHRSRPAMRPPERSAPARGWRRPPRASPSPRRPARPPPTCCAAAPPAPAASAAAARRWWP